MDKKKDTPKDNVGAFFQTCKVKGSHMRCVIAEKEFYFLILDLPASFLFNFNLNN